MFERVEEIAEADYVGPRGDSDRPRDALSEGFGAAMVVLKAKRAGRLLTDHRPKSTEGRSERVASRHLSAVRARVSNVADSTRFASRFPRYLTGFRQKRAKHSGSPSTSDGFSRSVPWLIVLKMRKRKCALLCRRRFGNTWDGWRATLCWGKTSAKSLARCSSPSSRRCARTTTASHLRPNPSCLPRLPETACADPARSLARRASSRGQHPTDRQSSKRDP